MLDDEEFEIKIEEEPDVEIDDGDDVEEEKPKDDGDEGYIVDELNSKTEDKHEKRKLTKAQRREFWRQDRRKLEATVKSLTSKTIEQEKQLQAIQGNQLGFRMEGLKNKKEEIQNLYQQTNNRLAEFEAANNLKGTREAVELRMRLEAEFRSLEQQEKELLQIAKQPTPLNESTKNYFKGWTDRNKEWYKQDLSNRSSRIADEISGDLLNEGFRTSEPEFWEELDRRCTEEIPAKAKTVTKSVREPVYDDEDEPPPQRISGKGSQTRGESGRPEVKIDAWTVTQWKNAGIWDDPKERQKAIKLYQSELEKDRKHG